MNRRTILQLLSAIAAVGSASVGVTRAHAQSSLFKAVYLVKRKDSLSYEEFVVAQNEHVPFAHALPGLRRYVLSFYPPVDGTDQPFDSAAAVYLDSRDAHDAALASPEGQAALADLSRYLNTDAITVLMGEETMDKTFPS